MRQISAIRPSYGVVVLTMGRRPRELQAAVVSLLRQQDVDVDVVVVGNGWAPEDLPAGIRTLHLPENVGIPAGRNAGVPLVAGDLLLFLDDDCRLLSPRFLAECADRLGRDQSLGLIQPRITDPDRPGDEPRRWIPRLRKGDPGTSSEIFSVLEAAVVLPRAVFVRAGGWPSEFFYAHEGIELAWRVWDQGLRVEYHGDLEVAHPVVEPTRHSEYYFLNARNRVWLARRCLPWPISWAYVAAWTGVQILRSRDAASLRTWLRGWAAGWTKRPWAERQKPPKLSWHTVARMTKHGRPPVI